jgi:cytochrome c oxidase subunit 2
MKASHRIVGIVIATAVAAALVVFSFVYDWFGPLIASEDGQVDSVYRWLLAASIPFFVIIVAIILYCVVEFRADPNDPDDKDGLPMHGSTRIEIVWTLIPTVIVIGLGIYAWMVLSNVEAKKPNELRVNVVGQQFVWNFEYPTYGIKTQKELVVPNNRPLHFRMTSADVIHSFYVPGARMKRDIADGFTTNLRFTPTKLGTYPIVCTELCGIGHSTMRSSIRIVSPAQFTAWAATQKKTGASDATGSSNSTGN